MCVFFIIFPKCPLKPNISPRNCFKKNKPHLRENFKSPLVKIGPFSDHQKLIFHLILPAGPSDGVSAQSPAFDEAERLPTTNSAQQRGYGLFRCSSRAAHKLSSSVIATFPFAPPLLLRSLYCCYYLAILRISLPALFAISRSSSSYK